MSHESMLGVLQTELDALRHLQAETAAELDALLPAILEPAFRGIEILDGRNRRRRSSCLSRLSR